MADASGNVYGETGEGSGPVIPGQNLGVSVLKLVQNGNNLSLGDYFTPYNWSYLQQNDLDLTTSVLILPDQPGPRPHLGIATGKQGILYVLNRDNMGQLCSPCATGNTQIVQELVKVTGHEPGSLVYWNNAVYSSGEGTSVSTFELSGGLLSTGPVLQSGAISGGHSPTISANGNSNGIVWVLSGSGSTVSLLAFDAATLRRLYTSSQLPPTPHFATQMTANGKVYVGTNISVVVYGLLNPPPTVATPTFSPAPGTYSNAQRVILSDSTSGATVHCKTDGSIPTASSPVCTQYKKAPTLR